MACDRCFGGDDIGVTGLKDKAIISLCAEPWSIVFLLICNMKSTKTSRVKKLVTWLYIFIYRCSKEANSSNRFVDQPALLISSPNISETTSRKRLWRISTWLLWRKGSTQTKKSRTKIWHHLYLLSETCAYDKRIHCQNERRRRSHG